MIDTPYAGGRWTEGRYKTFVRSALRRAWMKWPVRADVLLDARRPSQSDNKRLKWEYHCVSCGGWFAAKEVAVDHIEPVGSLDDASQFIGRLFCEIEGLQVLCHGCHQAKKET